MLVSRVASGRRLAALAGGWWGGLGVAAVVVNPYVGTYLVGAGFVLAAVWLVTLLLGARMVVTGEYVERHHLLGGRTFFARRVLLDDLVSALARAGSAKGGRIVLRDQHQELTLAIAVWENWPAWGDLVAAAIDRRADEVATDPFVRAVVLGRPDPDR